MEPNNMQAVIDAARQGAAPAVVHEGNGRKMIVIPGIGDKPGRLETVNTEELGAHPLRKRGTVQVFDAASLNTIMAENADHAITVYVDRNPTEPAVVAVLNGHGAKGPGWGDFRASINFRATPQWLKWAGIDGRLMSQQDFANFIEDNLLDVLDPAPADMLEISRSLMVTRTTEYKSVTRPKSGLIQFKNESADTFAESTRVPDEITLLLSPLFGVPPQSVTARFRYRIEGGALKLGVKLQRIEELMDAIMRDVLGAIVLPPGAVMVEGVAP